MATDTASKTQAEFQAHVDHHVLDGYSFDFPEFMGGSFHIPGLDGIGLPISKFMVLQILAGLLTLWVFSTLAKKIRNGEPLSSKFWNFWEMLAVAVRDQVVRPTIGDPASRSPRRPRRTTTRLLEEARADDCRTQRLMSRPLGRIRQTSFCR